MPARRITEQDIININTLYLQLGTYSSVAAELGFSPATVKRYVVPDYQPRQREDLLRYNNIENELEFEDNEEFNPLCD